MNFLLYKHIHNHHHQLQCSTQGQVLHCKLGHQGCNSAQNQVFHSKLRNLGCSFTRVLSAPHSLFRICTDLKSSENPRGTSEEVRRVDLASWALRTSPKFITGFKYQFHQGFFFGQIRDPEIPITPRPHKHIILQHFLLVLFYTYYSILKITDHFLLVSFKIPTNKRL